MSDSSLELPATDLSLELPLALDIYGNAATPDQLDAQVEGFCDDVKAKLSHGVRLFYRSIKNIEGYDKFPSVLFSDEHGICESFLIDVVGRKARMYRIISIDDVPEENSDVSLVHVAPQDMYERLRDLGTLESYFHERLEMATRGVSVVNSQCEAEGMTKAMEKSDIRIHSGRTLFPIVHRIELPVLEPRGFIMGRFEDFDESIKELLKDFEFECNVYLSLLEAYDWTFDAARVEHCREISAKELPSLLLDDDCIVLYRKVLLGKIGNWIDQNQQYWCVRTYASRFLP